MSKERYQNPRIGDELNLRLLVYNNNEAADVDLIEKVEIWKIDDNDPDNVSKRTLIETVDGDDVTHTRTGEYEVQITLSSPAYCIGKYTDIWYTGFETEESEECQIATIPNTFEIVRDLWFTSPSPLIYDFTFAFRPNKIRQGAKQYLIVNVIPNVPKASALEAYYKNIATVSPLKISIEQRCGDCLPDEQDLRLIVDQELLEFRESCLAYYFLDTTEMDCGIYDVFFQLEFAENTYISPKSQLQIF